MGTGVLSTLLKTAPRQFTGLAYVSTVFYLLNILLFVLFLVLSIARYTLYPWVMVRMLKHPGICMFLGTFPMALCTIINGTVLLVVPAFWSVGSLFGSGPVVGGCGFDISVELCDTHAHVSHSSACSGDYDGRLAATLSSNSRCGFFGWSGSHSREQEQRCSDPGGIVHALGYRHGSILHGDDSVLPPFGSP